MHQDSIGSHIAMTDGSVANYYNVIDFGSEVPEQEGQVVTKVMIHLQSRPFSFGYQYSHIHRIVSMIRSNIPITSTSAGIVVALYGSDDLQTWNLLSYANRRQVKVSQIRIPPAARSWRYYTICIGGYAPLDTDLGPSLVDFENVIRRIG